MELREWRKGGAERGRSDARTKKAKFEKAVAAAVEKKISEQVKASEEEKLAREKLRTLIASIVKETGGTTPPPNASTPSTPPSLKGILKKAKNDDKS